MSRREIFLSVLGFLALAVVLAIAYRAYFTPSMMIDLANLRLCG